MSYLIDTDWVIHHLRGNVQITRRIEGLFPEGIAISIISVAELYEGIANSDDPDVDEATLVRFINLMETLPINEDICKLFGKGRARLRVRGELIGDLDLLIGCTAAHHELTILTNNHRHFERIADVSLGTF